MKSNFFVVPVTPVMSWLLDDRGVESGGCSVGEVCYYYFVVVVVMKSI